MTEGIRGFGGIVLGAAAGIIASHVGVKDWELFAVFMLVSLGCPMLATGRLKGW